MRDLVGLVMALIAIYSLITALYWRIKTYKFESLALKEGRTIQGRCPERQKCINWFLIGSGGLLVAKVLSN